MHRIQPPSLSYSIVIFSSLARSRYLSVFSLSFGYTLLSAGKTMSMTRHVLIYYCLTPWGFFFTSVSANFKIPIVLTVWSRPIISKSFGHCTSTLVTASEAPITIGITVTFVFNRFYNPLKKSRYLSLFLSFNFTLPSVVTAKSTFSLFFVDYDKVWSSGGDSVIRLYLKTPEKFVSFILQERVWVMHKPFVSMVKFQFLGQFFVDHVAHPVVPSLIFFPC